MDRARFFTCVLKFLRYLIAPNRNYVDYKVKLLDQNLACGGPRILPIMNTNKEMNTNILMRKDREKNSLFAPY